MKSINDVCAGGIHMSCSNESERYARAASKSRSYLTPWRKLLEKVQKAVGNVSREHNAPLRRQNLLQRNHAVCHDQRVRVFQHRVQRVWDIAFVDHRVWSVKEFDAAHHCCLAHLTWTVPEYMGDGLCLRELRVAFALCAMCTFSKSPSNKCMLNFRISDDLKVRTFHISCVNAKGYSTDHDRHVRRWMILLKHHEVKFMFDAFRMHVKKNTPLIGRLYILQSRYTLCRKKIDLSVAIKFWASPHIHKGFCREGHPGGAVVRTPQGSPHAANTYFSMQDLCSKSITNQQHKTHNWMQIAQINTSQKRLQVLVNQRSVDNTAFTNNSRTSWQLARLMQTMYLPRTIGLWSRQFFCSVLIAKSVKSEWDSA